MKIRVLDRILVAIAGILLVAACAGLVAQVFFGVDVIGFVQQAIMKENTMRKVLVGVCAGVLLILGIYCLLMLFRHRRRKDKFILQKMESGDLAISLKTLETMVQKCMDQHQEIKTEAIRLENQRDGLLIRIRGTVAGGISIPLTVDTLQKQVKQYVTACSGVEVKGIRVQIEASGEEAKDAPFAIEPPTANLLPKGNSELKDITVEEPAEAERVETAVPEKTEPAEKIEKTTHSEEAAAAAAMASAESLMNELNIEDDRPIHQRLFSTQEEPCIMPLPPENLKESETAEIEEEIKEKDENTDKAIETAEVKQIAENAGIDGNTPEQQDDTEKGENLI